MNLNYNRILVWVSISIIFSALFVNLNLSSGSQNTLVEKCFEPNENCEIGNEKSLGEDMHNIGDFQDQIISEIYSFEFDPKFSKIINDDITWDRIEFENCNFNPIPWTPQVPFENFMLTTEGDIIDIELKFSNHEYYFNLNLPPAQEPQVLDNGKSEFESYQMSLRNKELLAEYQISDEYYPVFDYQIGKLDQVSINGKNYIIYSLQIYPLKYNPSLKTGIFYNKATVTIYYSPLENNTNHDVTNPNPNLNTRSSNNYEQTSTANNELTLGEGYKYLILTTADLVEELEPLAKWKQRKGVPTKIIDVETIYNNSTFNGYDEPEEIRNFIQYSYKNFNTEYVLLAGDWDTIPTRMCYDPDPYYGADDGEIPSDCYYSCITEGTTWDVDEDHIYGELGDLDDKIPDIIVGRIAINSEMKMSDWVKEVIAYECNPPDMNWTEKVTLIGPNVHNTGDGAKQSEYFYNKYLKFIYQSFDKLYESSDQGNKELSRSEVTKSVNNGAAFINYLGHGSPTVWTYNFGYNILLDKGDVSRFRNRGMKPVVYAMSCLTGWFDDTSGSGYGNFGDCIGETFTEDVTNGGIGYIGSARTSVGSINQNYGPFATGLQEDFIRQLSQYNFGLGSAFTEGKKHYSEVWGNYFEDTNSYGEIQACWLEVNLLGEPELVLWTKKPQIFNVTNITDEDTLTIIITNETGTPVKNAQVCLQIYDYEEKQEFINVKLTDSDGEVKFYVSGYPSILNLTITKSNFIPYLEKMTIADMIPPITTMKVTPEAPDGELGWYITTPIINLTINEEGTTYYFWDDSPLIIYTGPISPPEGNHELSYYSIDCSENIEIQQNYRIKFDQTPPECKITFDPEIPNGRNGWYIVQPIINITKEPGATVFYAFDEEVHITYNNPIFSPVGEHQLSIYSKDIAGNIGGNISMIIKVDIIPPSTDINISPEKPDGMNGWFTEPPVISFSTETGAETYYYWSFEDVDSNLTDPSDADIYDKPILCPEGKNVLNYFSVDNAGCREEVRTYRIKVDTIPPKSTHKLDPEEPDGENGYYVSELTITLTSAESGQIFYSWDDKYFHTYNKQIIALSGENTLIYYSMDEAGNIGEKTEMQLKVDTEAPETKLIIIPMNPTGEDGWYDTIPTITFETDPRAVVYYNFEWFEDTLAPEQIEVPEGINKIFYYSVDEAGNIGEKSWEIFKVDITPPTARLDVDKNSQIIGSVITFTAHESKDNNEISLYLIDFGDGENSGWIQTSFVKHIYAAPGEYEATLYVRDSAGLENVREEKFKVIVLNENENTDRFSFESSELMITIVISVFIVLSAAFIFVYRKSHERQKQLQIIKAHNFGHRLSSSAVKYEDIEAEYYYDHESDPAEAIVIEEPIVSKVQKTRCPGCNTIFIYEESSSYIKCPSCGLQGKLETNSKMSKFKCPSCQNIFKTSVTNDRIKCPSCGIEGQI